MAVERLPLHHEGHVRHLAVVEEMRVCRRKQVSDARLGRFTAANQIRTSLLTQLCRQRRLHRRDRRQGGVAEAVAKNNRQLLYDGIVLEGSERKGAESKTLTFYKLIKVKEGPGASAYISISSPSQH